ncbi:retrovirus-related pol polyprotein from transposon TNT 1-94 [Tanacetum coccineum]
MYNNIMADGSRDHPPMLATGRYVQWKSRFLRYIDTRPNGNALRKYILQGPYKLSTVIILAEPATDNSPIVPEQTAVETLLNMSPENKAQYQSEKEAIHLLLTGIGDEIYSIVDAYKTAYEMWIAIERLQQEWSRFVIIVKKTHDLDIISYHKLFDILKHYQKEVNKIHAKRITKNANPLALVATAQQYLDPYYQAPKSHKSYAPPSKQSSSTRSHASTRYKGKEIDKPITPLSESASEDDSDPEQAQRDKDMQKNLALIANYFKKIYKPTNNNLRTFSNTINKNMDTSPRYKNDNQTGQFGNQITVTVVGARETVGSQVVQQTGIQCFNCKEFRHFSKECRKPKRVKDYTYHKEKMLMCKQAEKGVPLQAEQADWLEDTDEEIDEQELKAHYSYMSKIQEVHTTDSGTDIEPLEKIVQLILFIVDFGCTKHMTGNLKLMSSPTQAWLWHQILSHLNFDYINLLSKKDIMIGLPKFKYVKDQLGSSCELSKAKRSSFKTKVIPSSKGQLNLLHMDLCGPMRVESINGKKYILVIIDDYSRYTWNLFLRSKDETPEVLKDFLKMIQCNLQAQVINVRTNRGTKFLNKTLHAYFKEEEIEHQTSTPCTP